MFRLTVSGQRCLDEIQNNRGHPDRVCATATTSRISNQLTFTSDKTHALVATDNANVTGQSEDATANYRGVDLTPGVSKDFDDLYDLDERVAMAY